LSAPRHGCGMGLTFLRHPKVDAPGICYGQSDVPLAAGSADAIARAVLQVPSGARILSSPAARCLALAQALDGPLTVEPRLQELSFGAWEGRPWAEIDRAESDPWAEDPQNRAPPGGETFTQLSMRVTEALRGVDNAIIVTHAGPIRAWQIALGLVDFRAAFARSIPFATPIHLPARTG
ncbi:MAG: histidine phosphatase family protein, partial [Pseudomonadota bacterium]